MIHPSVEQFTRAMEFKGLAPCPQDSRWEIPTDSDICTEVETIAFVFGMVRMLRPSIVVETGSNVGCVTRAILAAMDANAEGTLYTCDTSAEVLHKMAAQSMTARLVHFLESGSRIVQMFPDADMYWIDSSDESRMAELAWLRDHGKRGAVVLTHDTNLIGHVTEVHRTLPNWVLLPGPRGLGIATL